MIMVTYGYRGKSNSISTLPRLLKTPSLAKISHLPPMEKDAYSSVLFQYTEAKKQQIVHLPTFKTFSLKIQWLHYSNQEPVGIKKAYIEVLEENYVKSPPLLNILNKHLLEIACLDFQNAYICTHSLQRMEGKSPTPVPWTRSNYPIVS